MALDLYNPRSTRAHHARYGHGLKPWVLVLQLTTVMLLIVGGALLVVGSEFGWMALGLSAFPAMIAEWYVRELVKVPIDQKGESLDARVDADILGVLPTSFSPKTLAQAVALTIGGGFFATRFGVGGGFLSELVSDDPKDTQAVLSEIQTLSELVGGRVSAGVIIIALLRSVPAKKTLLGHLQLEEDDLIRGVQWYHRVTDQIDARYETPRKSGGIGRDWSFGYIPTLSRFGQNISTVQSISSPVRDETLNQVVQLLDGGRGSIGLIGQLGVGKTELVFELASRLMDPDSGVPQSLLYKQVFLLDASRLVTAASEGGIEELVETILGEAYSAKNVIVCLDGAELFFESGVGSVDISALLLPILEAARLPIILTMDEQRFLQISKRMPALAQSIQKVVVHPTSEPDTLKVLQQALPKLEYRFSVTYMYQALKEAYALSKRYVYDVSMPGQAISLLEAAAASAEDGLVTAISIQKAIESTTGVKTASVDDEAERDTLLNLEARIHERMIGQDRAVEVVSSALRRARAGVRNQSRPVGTFLFLGPTGVGKTELAKSLAAVYFGGEANMIRLDMNEFVSSEDVSRLIADGTQDPHSLTAQVMKKPFSVVLLDEIEKAHPMVLTTLLQLLDEGVLRDTRNREVSFRDTIVIGTSNANAERIQEYLHRGYNLDQFEETFTEELLTSGIFKPEFLNRFDELVVFRPLEKNELRQVVDLIMVSLNQNLEAQKISVGLSDEARDYLVDAGYDPRLGARPMRRVVQRAVENTVANLLLSKELEPGGSIEISLGQVQSMLDTKKRADAISDTTRSS